GRTLLKSVLLSPTLPCSEELAMTLAYGVTSTNSPCSLARARERTDRSRCRRGRDPTPVVVLDGWGPPVRKGSRRPCGGKRLLPALTAVFPAMCRDDEWELGEFI